MITTFILIGITAYVFSIILLEPEMIFGWYANLLTKLPMWLSKPLGLCEYCFAGQLALWYYLYANWSNYSIIKHIICISISIFTVELINLIKNRT